MVTPQRHAVKIAIYICKMVPDVGIWCNNIACVVLVDASLSNTILLDLVEAHSRDKIRAAILQRDSENGRTFRPEGLWQLLRDRGGTTILNLLASDKGLVSKRPAIH